MKEKEIRGLNKVSDTIIYLIGHAETVDENGIRNKNLHKAWMIGKYWHIHKVCDKIHNNKKKIL